MTLFEVVQLLDNTNWGDKIHYLRWFSVICYCLEGLTG